VNIYVIYKDGVVVNATTLPRVVQDEFKRLADSVDVWRNDKLVKTIKSVKEFNRFIDPPRGEDEETAGVEYEW
jgi:hypothetical protein